MDSCNYDTEAIEDDGSCLYPGVQADGSEILVDCVGTVIAPAITNP